MTGPGWNVPPGLPTDPLLSAVANAVATHRTRRVPLAVLRAAHARHDPTGATSSDSRARLAATVSALQATGKIRVPRSPRLWERHLSPALPLWVERPAVRSLRPEPSPARVWRPELAAAAAAASTPAEADVLARVDKFLRDGGADRPVVPHRERSVEMFGDEKRLDAVVRSRLFTTGALTLDLLRCYVAPLPLTAQHTGDPGPRPELLIVENHATYASALAVARERAQAGKHALAIGYGAGNQLPASLAGASQLAPVPKLLWYFGDLDEGGLVTARAADAAARAAGLPPLRPALPLYRALLNYGEEQPSRGGHVSDDVACALASWLGEPTLTSAAADILSRGQRLAQEWVGYERLIALPQWV